MGLEEDWICKEVAVKTVKLADQLELAVDACWRWQMYQDPWSWITKWGCDEIRSSESSIVDWHRSLRLTSWKAMMLQHQRNGTCIHGIIWEDGAELFMILESNWEINNMLTYYRESCEKKKGVTVQLSLDEFLRKSCTFPISTAFSLQVFCILANQWQVQYCKPVSYPYWFTN